MKGFGTGKPLAALCLVCLVMSAAILLAHRRGTAGVEAGATLPYHLKAEESTLRFVSIKNGDTPVGGVFHGLSGGLSLPDADGGAFDTAVTVSLDSIDSGLEARDANVRTYFFETGKNELFRSATFRATRIVDGSLEALTIGRQAPFSVEGEVSFHGVTQQAVMPLLVTKEAENRYRVETAQPLIFGIDKWEMMEPLKAMMQACGHKSVALPIIVTFNLVFEG